MKEERMYRQPPDRFKAGVIFKVTINESVVKQDIFLITLLNIL